MRRLLFLATLSAQAAIAAPLQHPILFVTQVPPTQTFASPAEVFFTQSAAPLAAPRGGDLWILYPDGTRQLDPSRAPSDDHEGERPLVH